MTALILIATTATAFMAEASVTKKAVRVWRTITYLLGVILVALLIARGDWAVVVVGIVLAAAVVGLGALARYIRTRRQGSEGE